MMNKRIILFFAGVLMSVMSALAQTHISGVVKSAEDNEPVIGASIMIQGGNTGTVTDLEGKFSLNVPAGKKLVFSYVGMQKQVLSAKQGMVVTMHPDSRDLDDIVVTGIVKTDKRLFTGASARIEADEAKLAGSADISRSLEGRVAGVQVSNVSSTFGAAPKIRVRGATSIYGSSKPLWVVDGVIYEDNVEVTADELASGDANTLISSAVAGLNSDDIESFQILKDGSATSIYGARAMGGVIVVTTKRGSKGRASISYSGEFTTRQKPSYSDYNIMNSQEMMGVYREMEDKGWLKFETMLNAQNTGIYGHMYQMLKQYNPSTDTFGLENTTAARNAYLQQAEMRNTDWFDLLFTNSIMQNHSVSISLGGDKSQTYFSLSVLDDPGLYVNRSSVRRYTFNGNTSYELFKNFTVKFAAQGAHRDQEAPGSLDRSKDPVSGEVKRDFDINPYSYALSASRCLDPYARYTRFYTGFNIFDELENNYQDISDDQLMFRAELEYKPVRGLTLNGLISTRMANSRRVMNVMDDSNQANAYRAGVEEDNENATIRDANSLLYTDPENPNALPVSVLPLGGIRYQYDNKMRSYNYRATADYRNVFNELHTLNALIGTEYSSVYRTATTHTGWGYQYNNGGVVYTPYMWLKQMNEENTKYFSDDFTRTNSLAFYANLVYSFNQCYTINGTFRYEGTNRLGKATSSRWLPTWNVSGSYDILRESFMKPTENWLSQLRLRLSYSLTADTGPASVTNATAIYKTESVWRPTNSAAEMQTYISDLANTELTYEKKHEFNVGLDLGFLDDRIGLTVDAYWRNNFDLIGQAVTQGVGGQIFKWANVADMKSNGIEVGLNTVNIRKPKFQWATQFAFSHEKSEITNLKTTKNAFDFVSATGDALEGYPHRSLFSYRFAGLNEEGLPMVYNENGVVTIGDINFQERENLSSFLVYEGSIDPTFYGSLNNSFSYNFGKYGKLGLDVYITYSGGNVIRLDPVFSSSYSDLESLPTEFKNRWINPGDELNTSIPAIASVNQVNKYGSLALRMAYNAYNYSTERVAKGDFVRLKQISLNYHFPQELLRKTRFLSSASLKLSATNLCLLYADKKLNGQDPEFVNAGGVSSPLTKEWTLTLKLGF